MKKINKILCFTILLVFAIAVLKKPVINHLRISKYKKERLFPKSNISINNFMTNLQNKLQNNSEKKVNIYWYIEVIGDTEFFTGTLYKDKKDKKSGFGEVSISLPIYNNKLYYKTALGYFDKWGTGFYFPCIKELSIKVLKNKKLGEQIQNYNDYIYPVYS